MRGHVTKFTYDGSHQMLTMKDPNCVAAGNQCNGVQNTYSSGKVTQQVDNLGRITTFSYATTVLGTTTTVTDPNGNVTREEYAANVLVSETTAYGTSTAATTTYAFDPGTLGVTGVTDPNGNSSVVSRDSQANVLSSTDALGRTSTATYNSFNEVLVATDPLGVATTNTYDANGNLTQTSTPLVGTANSKVTIYTYGDGTHPGDVTQMTDPNGKNWTYTYDTYGDQASVTDPMAVGDKATDVYDSAGRMTSKVTPLGNVSGGTPANYTSSYTYNAANQVLTAMDPLGNQVQNSYDANGNLSYAIDASGNTTNYVYDLDGERTSQTDGLWSSFARTIKTTFDKNGNVHQQVDGLGNPTTYSYDSLNRVISSSDPLLRLTSYTYDRAGNLLTLKDAKSQTTTKTYDVANQLVGLAYSDIATPNVAYAYDLDGQRTSMADGTGTTTYTWDSLHRLTQSTDGAGSQLQYGYDLNGQTTTIKYPGGVNTVTQGFDDAGRMTSVQDWLSHTTQYKYDANSNNYEIDFANGTKATKTFDVADRLMSTTDGLSGTNFLTLTYSRASNSVLTGDGTNSYSYDTLNRVTAANTSGYTYDAADRLTSKAVTAGYTTTLTYDVASEVKSNTVMNGGTQVSKLTYSYDANGNRTRSIDAGNANTTYGYDQANRLTTFANSSTSATYAYNGDGQLMNTGGAAFVWNTRGSQPLIVKNGITSYVNGPDGLPLEQVTGGGSVYYYHADQIGNTRAMTDSIGSLVRTYAYDPYGNITSTTGTAANPFQFQGQFLDAISGLYYLRARYYDPSTAQFLSRDPIVAVTGFPYAFAGGSPLNAIDPAGTDAFGLSLPIGGALGIALGALSTAVLWGVLPAVAVIAAFWPVDVGGVTADDPNVYMARNRSNFPAAPKGWGGNLPETWNNGFQWQGQNSDTAVDPTGTSWHWHPEDSSHYEHWDCEKNGRNTRRGPNGEVLSDDQVFKKPASDQSTGV